MVKKRILISVLVVISFISYAQDTMYIYSNGLMISKTAIDKIDSIIFHPVEGLNETTVVDVDGNVYNSITIGTQTWMAENLKTTKYKDGTNIPNVTQASSWSILTTPAYCWYNNNNNNKNTYGALYNWYAVKTDNLCPSGWHIPSDTEWTILELFLQNNGYNYDGTIDNDNDRATNNKIAKSLASSNIWKPSTIEGGIGNLDYPSFINKTGFTALPGGRRRDDPSGNCIFEYIDFFGWWWSLSEISGSTSYFRRLRYGNIDVFRESDYKNSGLSVRCLKN